MSFTHITTDSLINLSLFDQNPTKFGLVETAYRVSFGGKKSFVTPYFEKYLLGLTKLLYKLAQNPYLNSYAFGGGGRKGGHT